LPQTGVPPVQLIVPIRHSSVHAPPPEQLTHAPLRHTWPDPQGEPFCASVRLVQSALPVAQLTKPVRHP
jgi:hypothetical protein